MAARQRAVDPEVWRACAGNLTHIPELNSRVYYFPQGHIHQSSDPIAVNQAWRTKPAIMCRVIAVVFLADPITDEVFVKFTLQRYTTLDSSSSSGSSGSASSSSSSSGSGVNDNGVRSFAKVLTRSDAHNGGGFSVPRVCADTIFPRLNFEEDPPLQYLTIRDLHGEEHSFRHIFRGTPRRHLLTSGWSTFVNKKRLIMDDTVVFIKKTVGRTDELFVGVRRVFRSAIAIPEEMAALADVSNLAPRAARGGGGGAERGLGGFSRLRKGRLQPKDVVEAIEKAVSGATFEAVYYPRPGCPEFVVAAEKVEKAVSRTWTNGVRVRIARDTDDGARFTWYNGTVASVGTDPDRHSWPGSWWRLLEVAWDEPDTLQDWKTVNPWQVEIVGALPEPPEVPEAKRRRGVLNSGLLTEREGDPPVPSMNLDLIRGQLNPSYLNCNFIPVGMQGARQNVFNIPNLSYMVHCDDHTSSLLQNVVAESAKLNIGNSLLEASLPDNHTSAQRFITADTEQCQDDSTSNITEQHQDNSTSNDTEQRQDNSTSNGVSSFLLFGTVIVKEQPLAKGDDMK